MSVCAAYAAFNVLELGQDVQRKAVRLSSGSIPSIHEVSKSQNQT